jgi:hypothetical protein
MSWACTASVAMLINREVVRVIAKFLSQIASQSFTGDKHHESLSPDGTEQRWLPGR